MAKGVRVTMNSEGARAVLNDPSVVSDLQRRGDRVAAAANAMMGPPAPTDEYVYRALPAERGKIRARAAVSTGGFTSRRDNAKNNTLLKALESGR